MKVLRADHNPIITDGHSPVLGGNINGPSLIRVPEWAPAPLGGYYLYFAHHKGKGIRLAYADEVQGPYTVHEPGALSLESSLFPTTMTEDALDAPVRRRLAETGTSIDVFYTHIASPDVHVDHAERQIRLYYHGMHESGRQVSRVAVSRDGINFEARPEVIGNPYLRVFQWDGWHYAMAMPGVFYRSRDGLGGFESGPSLFNPDMRHGAMLLRDQTLSVFWTQVGDTPERILCSSVDVEGDWMSWRAGEPREVLRPEMDWEGSALPLEASVRGAIEVPVNQLRDPGIFEEDDDVWLLYSVAGESGIGLARLIP